VLRLLIDTSAWLDMATRREGQKWIVPLRVLKSQGKLELLVPALIIEEFDRNRPRSESAVTTSVLDRLRQLRRELREYAGDTHEHIWLAETAQHIPLVNATAPQNFREIDELLRDGTILEPAEPEYARAIQRGLDKRAPFTSDKVWYVRSIVYDDDKRDLPDDTRTGMMASRERVEAKYGRDELWKAIGPGHDEAWQYGYISGELATLRWVLGSEWDFLNT
jgi:hypothetical protein